MNFTLSTAAVVETVQALAAFDVLYTSSPSLSSDKSPVETSRFASLLDPDRRDLLQLAVKDSFAEIVLLLLPYVETVDFGGDDEAATTSPSSSSSSSDGDGSSDSSMSVGLRVPPTISQSVALLIRRRFEQAVAMRVLANVAATVGGDSGSKDSSDDDFSARSRDAVDALIAALRSPFRPRVRARGY